MILKLGKRLPRFDKRTIRMKSVIRKELLPPLPEEWEFGKAHPEFDLSPRLWGNSDYGNCVFVSSVAQQRDFELVEQRKVIPIDEKQLINAYLKEAGGDYGLVMLDHLKVWKKKGLPIGQKRNFFGCSKIMNYQIYAFTSIDWQDQEEIKYATYLLGCNIGASMPDSFAEQFDAGHPWDDISMPMKLSNGHAMKVRGWFSGGLILWTWGKLQYATWPWISRYCDEAYCMIDDKNRWLGDRSPLDIPKLEQILREITA